MKNGLLMRKTTYMVKYKPEHNHGMTENSYLFRSLSSPHYQYEVPLLALDEYKPDSHGEDDFSRKQAWFYTYGDEDIKEEFRSQFVDLINKHFADDSIEWDLMTLYPSHAEGVINPNLRGLMMDVASDTGISFEQILQRSHTVRESHELQDEKAKVVNLEGSIDIDRNVEGKNIILVDNIALSGISLIHGANRLKQEGAENVLALCIGTKTEGKNASAVNGKQKASQLL